MVRSGAIEHVHIMSQWAKAVVQMSGGTLTIKIYPGGSPENGAAAQFKCAVDGAAEITFGIPRFTPSIFPHTTIIEYALMVEEGTDGGLEMGPISPRAGIDVCVVTGVAEAVPMGQIVKGIRPFGWRCWWPSPTSR